MRIKHDDLPMFRCDKCNTKLLSGDRITIFVNKNESKKEHPIKYCDLCKKCYSKIIERIKKNENK